ncbi:MAG: hypothetical protein JNL90_17055 [Planctomycetes bacterium]|nr:hypothetical protein [Planctomycetota bacterium]
MRASLAHGSPAAASPAPLDAADRLELELTPVAGFDGHLFSSYLYATTFFPDLGFEQWRALTLRQYGDPRGQVGLLVDHRDDLFLTPDVKVIVEANDFMGESELEHELASAAVHRFFPKIDWDFEKLRALDEERLLSIKFRVELDGKPYRKLVLPVRLHPIHDCPFALTGLDSETLQGLPPPTEGASDAADDGAGDGGGGAANAVDRGLELDQSWMFAAYVNERHPLLVDELVPALTRQGFVRDLTGYQAGRSDEVHRQVLSIWKLLRDRGIRYSSVGTLRGSGHVAWQHVRTIEQSLAAAQANCVDGSVLMASLLIAIGLDPFLVITPSHCYLGFFLGAAQPDGTREFSLLETTLLGAEVAPANVPPAALADFRRIARGAGSDDASAHEEDPLIASYVAALLAGMQHWSEDQPHLQPTAAEPSEPLPPEPGYAWVKIAELRARGLGSIRR